MSQYTLTSNQQVNGYFKGKTKLCLRLDMCFGISNLKASLYLLQVLKNKLSSHIYLRKIIVIRCSHPLPLGMGNATNFTCFRSKKSLF